MPFSLSIKNYFQKRSVQQVAQAELERCREEKLKSILQVGLHQAHVASHQAHIESLLKFLQQNPEEPACSSQ